jgi:nicotinate-nucleotide pyrophosphorylase (carboxylating)
VKLTADVRALIKAAIKEDLGRAGDLTSNFFVPARTTLKGRIIVKQPGIVAGLQVAEEVFRLRGCRTRRLRKDGSPVAPGRAILEVSGGRALLTAERTALNFLQRMSGVATLTKLYVRETRGTRARIYDTRKTLPGWRVLDKYAVLCGGGRNHRMGLYDAVLVKDNHWAAGMDVVAQVRAVRKKHPRCLVELEAADLAQVERALRAKPDVILLDNMGIPLLKKAIRMIRSRSKTEIEISGGVDLTTVRKLARLDPDRISVGRLTHSAPALDMSLEIE